MKNTPLHRLNIIRRLGLNSHLDTPEHILERKITQAKKQANATHNQEEKEALESLIQEYERDLAVLNTPDSQTNIPPINLVEEHHFSPSSIQPATQHINTEEIRNYASQSLTKKQEGLVQNLLPPTAIEENT